MKHNRVHRLPGKFTPRRNRAERKVENEDVYPTIPRARKTADEIQKEKYRAEDHVRAVPHDFVAFEEDNNAIQPKKVLFRPKKHHISGFDTTKRNMVDITPNKNGYKPIKPPTQYTASNDLPVLNVELRSGVNSTMQAAVEYNPHMPMKPSSNMQTPDEINATTGLTDSSITVPVEYNPHDFNNDINSVDQIPINATTNLASNNFQTPIEYNPHDFNNDINSANQTPINATTNLASNDFQTPVEYNPHVNNNMNSANQTPIHATTNLSDNDFQTPVEYNPHRPFNQVSTGNQFDGIRLNNQNSSINAEVFDETMKDRKNRGTDSLRNPDLVNGNADTRITNHNIRFEDEGYEAFGRDGTMKNSNLGYGNASNGSEAVKHLPQGTFDAKNENLRQDMRDLEKTDDGLYKYRPMNQTSVSTKLDNQSNINHRSNMRNRSQFIDTELQADSYPDHSVAVEVNPHAYYAKKQQNDIDDSRLTNGIDDSNTVRLEEIDNIHHSHTRDHRNGHNPDYIFTDQSPYEPDHNVKIRSNPHAYHSKKNQNDIETGKLTNGLVNDSADLHIENGNNAYHSRDDTDYRNDAHTSARISSSSTVSNKHEHQNSIRRNNTKILHKDLDLNTRRAPNIIRAVDHGEYSQPQSTNDRERNVQYVNAKEILPPNAWQEVEGTRNHRHSRNRSTRRNPSSIYDAPEHTVPAVPASYNHKIQERVEYEKSKIRASRMISQQANQQNHGDRVRVKGEDRGAISQLRGQYRQPEISNPNIIHDTYQSKLFNHNHRMDSGSLVSQYKNVDTRLRPQNNDHQYIIPRSNLQNNLNATNKSGQRQIKSRIPISDPDNIHDSTLSDVDPNNVSSGRSKKNQSNSDDIYAKSQISASERNKRSNKMVSRSDRKKSSNPNSIKATREQSVIARKRI
tara:strand:- start:3532 stop:6261 length:2730 start_codon:yes stop_codon:yes gene_type:complete